MTVSHITVRRMNEDDLSQTLVWRNPPDVRRHMRTQHEISAQEYQAWFNSLDPDSGPLPLIAESNCGPMGFVQFSDQGAAKVTDWGFYTALVTPKGSGQRLGFAHEGVLRQHQRIDGAWQDLVLWGLLRSDWTASPAHHQGKP